VHPAFVDDKKTYDLFRSKSLFLCLLSVWYTHENNEVNWKVLQCNLLKAILQNIFCYILCSKWSETMRHSKAVAFQLGFRICQ